MNPLKEVFESGQTILWVETQNAVAFLGPVPDILVWTPCPTACLAESLRLRQVRLAALQLLSQLLLFGHIGAGAAIAPEFSVGVKHWFAAGLHVHWKAVSARGAIDEVTERST